MKSKIRNLILKLIPAGISNHLYYNHPGYKKTQDGYISFSQDGEDMVLRRIFSGKLNGTYVDIGAHHPSLYSNTNYFYQNGWTGINIDPLPGNKLIFDAKGQVIPIWRFWFLKMKVWLNFTYSIRH